MAGNQSNSHLPCSSTLRDSSHWPVKIPTTTCAAMMPDIMARKTSCDDAGSITAGLPPLATGRTAPAASILVSERTSQQGFRSSLCDWPPSCRQNSLRCPVPFPQACVAGKSAKDTSVCAQPFCDIEMRHVCYAQEEEYRLRMIRRCTSAPCG